MPAALPEQMRALYDERREAIQQRLRDFAAVPVEKYFYELCYCLLTPQASARNVEQVIAILEDRDFLKVPFDPVHVLRSSMHYVRFHITKSKRLLKVREQHSEIISCILSPVSWEEKRSWLARHVDGLSLKEASHLLRNIGARNLAIIDRHVITHLVACGVLRRKPSSITPKRYFAIERKFRKFSSATGIPMDELDLLFWSNETGIILK